MKIKMCLVTVTFFIPAFIIVLDFFQIDKKFDVLLWNKFHEDHENISNNTQYENYFLCSLELLTLQFPCIPEAIEVLPKNVELIETGKNAEITFTSEELTYSSKRAQLHSTLGVTKSILGFLGEGRSTVSVGNWTNYIVTTFKGEPITLHDRFCRLIDLAGVCRTIKRDVGSLIIASSRYLTALGSKYSFKVQEDIIIRKEEKEKQYWENLFKGQYLLLDELAKGYVSEIEQKSQYHQQHTVRTQSYIIKTLINSIEAEVHKSLIKLLSTSGQEGRVFGPLITYSCRDEADDLMSLYDVQESDNDRPVSTPSQETANRFFSRLHRCHQHQFDSVLEIMDSFLKDEAYSHEVESLHDLFNKVIVSKRSILETANHNLNELNLALQDEILVNRFSLIDYLFDSGVIEKTHYLFIEQSEKHSSNN
ncbi:hypothetical protein L4D04_23325 [Photobacterium angustum]|uniref:hypothetical protein n=1 Tax=Photobacterium angustum TaxID=661 RepID=UPI003D0B619E